VATGVKVSGKAIAKIVVEYAVLVTVLHAPGIAGRAAKAAAEANAGKVQESLAKAGITVTRQEAKLIAKELADSGNPEEVLGNLHKSAQDMADAVEAIEKGSKKHGL
jgi:hypothetical protein